MVDPRKSSTSLEAAAQGAAAAQGFRRDIEGKVVSDKMDKTVVVECTNYSRDPLYGKYVKTKKRHKAHDETNQYKTGDLVIITEHRPISAEKRFIVSKLVKKFIEE